MKKTLLTLLVTTFCLISCNKYDKFEIKVLNSSEQSQINKTVEIPISKLPFAEQAQFAIVKNSAGEILPSQITYDNLLIFQLSLNAGENQTITISEGDAIQTFKSKVYGRLIPERKDDWAWENDKIAYRIYGPALQATGEISNAIDVWLKRTENLVIDKWYASGNYHTDHGEGLDCYMAGRTLGAGALSPIVDNKFALGRNFISGKTLDKGPIRYTFMVNYNEETIYDKKIVESRIISLDAGSQLSKITVNYASDDTFDLPVGIGIISRGEKENAIVAKNTRTISYSEPENKNNGTTHIGIVTSCDASTSIIDKHFVLSFETKTNTPITYYAGAGWSKFGFTTPEEWRKYINDFDFSLQNPLTIKYPCSDGCKH